MLTQFGREYPNIEVAVAEVNSREMEQQLLDGDLDLILTNRFFQKEKLEIIPVYNDFLLMSIRPDHPACAHAKSLPGHEYPWLDLNLVQMCIRDRWNTIAPSSSKSSMTLSVVSSSNVRFTRPAPSSSSSELVSKLTRCTERESSGAAAMEPVELESLEVSLVSLLLPV